MKILLLHANILEAATLTGSSRFLQQKHVLEGVVEMGDETAPKIVGRRFGARRFVALIDWRARDRDCANYDRQIM
jgi:hypothetical protein